MRTTATSILSALACERSELSLALVGDAEMRRLNRRYRGRDRTTDVLAFPQPGPAAGLLGDVVISAPALRRQAAELGHSEAEEFTRLLIHGVLHLQGHEHEAGGAPAARMRRQEAALWRRMRGKPA